MKKKKIWLMGGIGNNLFQMFFGYVLERSNHKIYYVENLTQSSWVTKFLRWKIHDNTYKFFLNNNKLIRSSNFIVFLGLISKKINSIFFKVLYFQEKNTENFVNADNYFGYYQNKLLLQKYDEEFKDFCSKIYSHLLLENFKASMKTVVHFRGGDSLWAKQNASYYLSVKKRIKKIENVLIISDDIDAAKNYFGESKNLIFRQSPSPLDDFRTLVLASNIYCAPSTFSWWAAHCATNAKVVAPKFLEDSIGYYICDENLTLLE